MMRAEASVTRSGIEGSTMGKVCYIYASLALFGLSLGRPPYNSLQWTF